MVAQMKHNVDLRDHQRDAVQELQNGNVLLGGVGSGKSRTAIAYYIEKEAPKTLYVITTAKKRDSLDWEGEAARFALGKTADSTIAGVLTVDSWNNIGKYKDVSGAFFIFDEHRLSGSGAWVKNFLKITAKNRWILLSATPGDTWTDYIPVFIANGFYKNRTEFLREHVVYNSHVKYPKIQRYLGVGKLNRLRNKVIVHMPYQSHLEINDYDIFVDHNQELYRQVIRDRWNIYENRPVKNISEMFYILRKLVNSDFTRQMALLDLSLDHPKMIVFYNFNYELDKLREGATLWGIPYAEWNGHKHEDIPKTDRWMYFVQYMSGSEGWNCTETGTICFYSLTYSYKMYKQAKGRVDRMDSMLKKIDLYTLISDSSIDRGIQRALREKRNFNEKTEAKRL